MDNEDFNQTGFSGQAAPDEERAEGPTTSDEKSGFSAGKEDAAAAAKRCYAQFSKAMGKAAYGLSYYSAFGISFAAALVREAIPSRMRDGFAEGAKAGDDAAQKTMDRVKESFTGTEENESDTRGTADGLLPAPESA